MEVVLPSQIMEGNALGITSPAVSIYCAGKRRYPFIHYPVTCSGMIVAAQRIDMLRG
jgi:hypothetical protein